MNEVNVEEIFDELGYQGVFDLMDIERWLNLQSEDETISQKFIRLKHQESNWGEAADRFRSEFGKLYTAQYSPSIISRGSAEFFETSLPRFGIRLKFGDQLGSIVNLRRLASLSNHAGKWGKRNRKLSEDERTPNVKPWRARPESPGGRLSKSTAIGDCLFPIPERFATYVTVAKDFSKVYGEMDPTCDIDSTNGSIGVPYLRNIQLAGLCAQAVCFMASTLLHNFAKGVFGVSEISYLAKQEGRKELELGGLSPKEIVAYFQHPKVGLHAEIEWAGAGTDDNRLKVSTFERAVQSYLRSGFPVILLVDAGRMAGMQFGELMNDPICAHGYQTIYQSNGFEKDSWYRDFRTDTPPTTNNTLSHAVLAIGFCEDSENLKFLINDSSSFPFITATARQLSDAATYVAAKGKITKLENIHDCCFIPVTPSPVKLPLAESVSNLVPMDERVTREQKRRSYEARMGVLRLSEALRLGAFSDDNPSYHLVFFDGSEIAPDCTPSVGESIRFAVNSWYSKEKIGSKFWAWVEHFPKAQRISIWDAERPALLINSEDQSTHWDLTSYRLAEINYGRSDCQLSETTALKTNAEPEMMRDVPLSLPDCLEGSLITSFHVKGLEPVAKVWPDYNLAVDAYCFMERDTSSIIDQSTESWHRILENKFRAGRSFARNYFRRNRERWEPARRCGVILSNKLLFRRTKPSYLENELPIGFRRKTRSPLEVVAALAEKEAGLGFSLRPRDIPPMGELGRKMISELPDAKICSFTTYWPEIVASDAERRKQTITAIAGLMRLAVRVNPDLAEKKRFVIEVVGGGLAERMWRGRREYESENQKTKTLGEEVWIANLLSEGEAIERLIESLRMENDLLYRTYRDTGVRLAFELEPGPLYTLGSKEQLLEFCKKIEDTTKLKEFVGVNLDIAHFSFIEGITREWIEEHPVVKNRIIHCHLSDHCDGAHFGDLVPRTFHRTEVFQCWIDYIATNIAGADRELGMEFSGFISGELEAAKNSTQVEQLAKFLAGRR